MHVLGISMLFGGIVLFFAARAWQYEINVDTELILGLLAIVIVGTVIAYGTYLMGVRYMGSVKASLIACIEPVVATVLSATWMKAEFKIIDLIGFAAILSTVFILAAKDGRKDSK